MFELAGNSYCVVPSRASPAKKSVATTRSPSWPGLARRPQLCTTDASGSAGVSVASSFVPPSLTAAPSSSPGADS